MITLLVAFVHTSQMVSLTDDSLTLGGLVKEMALQSGQPLACDKSVRDEPIICQFENVAIDDLEKRVAAISDTEWVDDNGSITLTRTPDLKRQQAATENAFIEAELGKRLAKWMEELGHVPPFSATQAENLMDGPKFAEMDETVIEGTRSKLTETNPLSASVLKLMNSLGAKKLAAMRMGERMVFSDRPTAAQIGVPVALRGIIGSLQVSAKLMKTAKDKVWPAGKHGINFADLPQLGPSTVGEGYGKTNFAIQRIRPFLFRVEVTMVDSHGLGIVRNSTYLPDYGRGLAYNAPSLHKGIKLEITPEQDALAQLSQTIGMAMASGQPYKTAGGKSGTAGYWITKFEKDGKDPVAPFRLLLQDPVKNDPIGTLVGPMLRQIAKAENRPLLAIVPDGAFSQVTQGMSLGSVVNEEDLWDYLTLRKLSEEARTPEVVVDPDDTWLTVKPYLPVRSRALRQNRLALKNLIDAMKKRGALSLQDAATYLTATRIAPTLFSMDTQYLSNAVPQVSGSAVQQLFTPVFPLLASLKPGQWRVANRGELRTIDLLPEQKEILRKWIFETNMLGSAVPEPDLRNMALGRAKPLTIEPTEVFPNGMPTNATIEITDTNTQIVVANSREGFSFTFEPDELAASDFNVANAGTDEMSRVKRNLFEFRLGEKIGYSCDIGLTPALHLRLNSSEVSTDPKSGFVPRSALPADFLAEVEAIRKALAGR